MEENGVFFAGKREENETTNGHESTRIHRAKGPFGVVLAEMFFGEFPGFGQRECSDPVGQLLLLWSCFEKTDTEVCVYRSKNL